MDKRFHLRGGSNGGSFESSSTTYVRSIKSFEVVETLIDVLSKHTAIYVHSVVTHISVPKLCSIWSWFLSLGPLESGDEAQSIDVHDTYVRIYYARCIDTTTDCLAAARVEKLIKLCELSYRPIMHGKRNGQKWVSWDSRDQPASQHCNLPLPRPWQSIFIKEITV